MEERSEEFEVGVGMEHCLIREEAQETWSKTSKKNGFKRAVAEARITKEHDWTGRCALGGVMIAADQHIATAVETNGRMVGAGEETSRQDRQGVDQLSRRVICP